MVYPLHSCMKLASLSIHCLNSCCSPSNSLNAWVLLYVLSSWVCVMLVSLLAISLAVCLSAVYGIVWYHVSLASDSGSSNSVVRRLMMQHPAEFMSSSMCLLLLWYVLLIVV